MKHLTLPMPHAPFSPSAAHRWLICPASVKMSSGYENNSSAYAEEGTKAHEYAAKMLLDAQGLESTEVTPWNGINDVDMKYHASQYLEYAKQLAKEANCRKIHVETPVALYPNCYGTADCLILGKRTLVVLDYKYGQGVQVDAFQNEQLMTYAAAALQTFYKKDVAKKLLKRVILAVFQPRKGGFSQFETTPTAVLEHADRVQKAIDDASEIKPKYKPSAKGCMFCLHRQNCGARREYATALDTYHEGAKSPEYMATMLDRSKVLKALITEVEEEALELCANNGANAVTGYKAVWGQTRRSITDEAGAFDELASLGYTAEDITTTSLKTMGNLKKLVGKDFDSLITPYCTSSEAKLTLATMEDKREAICRTAEAFSQSIDNYELN